MIRHVRAVTRRNIYCCVFVPKQNFLTNNYKCDESWRSQSDSLLFSKVNLNDFYNLIDQNYSSKGVISAIDVDIFANALKDSSYIDELKDLLHKLRLSAETGSTLESTHHATIRNFIEFNKITELIDILQDPLNYGVFLDDFTANILLDNLITSKDYKNAAKVSSLIMLQENYSNDITVALSQYACYKYISSCGGDDDTKETSQPQDTGKIEVKKIRIKYLRNPYYDDHFDIKDNLLLSGKTLAWMSKRDNNNLNKNLEIIGWMAFKKFDTLLTACEDFVNSKSKTAKEVVDILNNHSKHADGSVKDILIKCVTAMESCEKLNISLEELLKNTIENAINKVQAKDIASQKQLFETWKIIREKKLEEQTKRLERARRVQDIENKNKSMEVEEQKLWFFDNEEKIDLEIEEKEKLEDETFVKKVTQNTDDHDYIPPEIRPHRK